MRTDWCVAINFSFRDRNLIEPLRRLRSVNGREEPLSFRRRSGKRKRLVWQYWKSWLKVPEANQLFAFILN